MTDQGEGRAGDPDGYVPRDTAERVLRLAIEMEARRGEILTEDELFRIADDVGVHPEYVRRALAAERASESREREDASQHRAREPVPMLNRVLAGVFSGVVLLLGLGMLPMAVAEIGRSLAGGLSAEALVNVFLVVLQEVGLVGLGTLGLRMARRPPA